MYSSGQEAVDGFTKNLFAVFGYRLIPFLFAYLWLLVMFWEPLMKLTVLLSGQANLTQASAVFICIALSIIIWLIPYVETRIPFGLAFLYPVTIILIVLVACRSLIYSLGGKIMWKDRAVAKARWKWL
jgi:chlorobactene glucosyltransferase